MLLNSHEAILHEDGVTYIWIMGFAIHLEGRTCAADQQQNALETRDSS